MILCNITCCCYPFHAIPYFLSRSFAVRFGDHLLGRADFNWGANRVPDARLGTHNYKVSWSSRSAFLDVRFFTSMRNLAWISEIKKSYQRALNAVQWRLYSFALIHAESKTRFSTGKQRNIVRKYLHSTKLLLKIERHNSVVKLDRGSARKNDIRDNSKQLFKTTTICFNLKEENKKEKLTESLHLTVEMKGSSKIC